MAKQLWLTDSDPTTHRGNNDAKLNGTASWWLPKALAEARGAFLTAVPTPTVAGPTNGIETADTGTPLEWLSEPLSADFTIAGTITANLWANESAAAANAAINFVVEKIDGATGALTQVVKSARVTELGTTSAAANFTATPTSTACKSGDRLRVRVFADDAGTMGVATFTLSYAGTTAAANGDSWVQFTENLTFYTTTTPTGSTYYLTDAAESINPGAATEKKALTTRGSGSVTAVTNTAAGPVAPIQVTDSGGGTALEWYTPPLEAVTFVGRAKFNVRMWHSNIAANASGKAEIAVVNGDGTGAVVWGSADMPPAAGGPPFGAADTTGRADWVAGASLAVTAGQRLRFRLYIDDVAKGPMGASQSVSVSYNGTTAAAAGDTYVILPVAVVESSTGPTTWNGSASVSLTDTRVTAATRQTFVAAAVALADVVATAGSRKALGAAAVALVDTLTTAARRVGLGAATVALVNSRVTNATRKTLAAATVALVNVRTTAARFTAKSGSAVALTDTITTNGTASAGATTYLGSATVALTDSRVTAARVTMKSAATVALTDGRVTNATRIARAAATVALTNTRVTAARFTAKAPTSTAEVVGIVTAARRVLVAASTVALTNLRTTAARITARSATTTAETATVTTNGVSGAGAVTYFGSATVALTDARVTNATRTTYSASTVSLLNVRVTAARVTFRGASVVALTNSRTTVAVRRANASASVQLANVRVTAARLTAKTAALTRSETVTVTTNGTKTGVKLGAASVALTDTRTTNATRKTFAVVSRVEAVAVTTSGTATVGAVTYLGAAAVQLTDARTTSGTRKTFAVISRIETATVTTRGARVWFGATSTSETVTVTTGSRSRTNAAATVALRALLFTSAESIVPLPPGSIDSGNSGSLGNGGHTGRIDYVNQGGLGRGRGGRIARTTHG